MTDTHTPPPDDLALSLDEYSEFLREIEEQPPWRAVADKEMDYADGNQLDSALLRKQQELGIPPAVEDLVGPALLSIQGYETATRTDWRVTPNGQPDGQDVSDALSFKLNEAERESGADQACGDAFRPQAGIGIGWVEVSRSMDPFDYPYRCLGVHRNEIHWDWKAARPDLSDARYLRRQRWLHSRRIADRFPAHRDLIQACAESGGAWWAESPLIAADGGGSTGLNNAWNEARGWSIQEDRWYNPTSKELCLAEVWYRRWVPATVIKSPDGRVVEYDPSNQAHAFAVHSGRAEPMHAIIARVRRSYWLGPHCLHDGPTPYTHRHFPYVPFWAFREDTTRVPYGYVRSMVYQQDSLNSGNSKLRWGMSVVRTERTKGAVAMTDAQLRKQVARADADIVLDATHMAQPGARFEVHRDYQLTDQHFQLMQDARMAIERVSSVTAGFIGRQGTARSGVQEQTQVEQSNQSLGKLMDNFRTGRAQVGELLLAMIIKDMGDAEQVIVIEGDAVRADRTVVLNRRELDPATNTPYLTNDLQRTRLKVALEDVPSSASYRGQQLNAMSESVKALPAQYQAAMMPFMVALMDVPFKRDVVEAIRAAAEQESPDQIESRIKEAVRQALAGAGNELKAREVAIKERKSESEIKELEARAVQVGVQAAFSAMQAGAQIATMPQIAPVADAVMQGAGYQRPNPMGDDPNFPQAAMPAQVQAAPVQPNTSPSFPPVPSDGASPMTGIETPRISDNLAPE